MLYFCPNKLTQTISMKKIIIASCMLVSKLIFAQIGINTPTPNATLDVVAKTTNGSQPEGIIAPRLTGDQIKSGDAQYTANQRGALVYATSAVGTASTKTANITRAGYYYFDGALWQRIINDYVNIYNSNGTLEANRTVTMADKTLDFTSTATTGTSHFQVDGTTLNVDAVNDRIGLGTAVPTTKLHINGTTPGAIRIVDGTQGAGKVLISDANGVGTWGLNTDTNTNIYNSNGTLAANRVVTMADKTLNFTSSATTGTSHFQVDGTTLNVDAVNNRVGVGTNAPAARLHVAAPASGDPVIVGGVQNGNVNTDAILGITSTGAIKKLGTLNGLSVPAPALFRLPTERTNFLNGVNPGASQMVPMVLVKNAIPGLTFNATTRVITFPAGTYQITFVYEAIQGYPGCNISSYFMDFPSDSAPFVRIHSNAPHIENFLGIHGGSIIHSTHLNAGQQLAINMGRGQAGNCTGPGMRLAANSTHLLIYRLGD